MLIGQAQPESIRALGYRLKERLQDAMTLEEAGQAFVEEIYRDFSDSISLIRFFLTIPMAELPAEIQDFTNRLAKGAKIATPLAPQSYVLTCWVPLAPK